MDMTTRSLSDERNARAREFLRELIDREFEGNISAASRALGITYSALHEVLNGRRGAGMKVLDALKAHTGKSIESILGEAPVEDGTVRHIRASDHPTWKPSLEAAKKLAPEVPEWAWDAAANAYIPSVTGRALKPAIVYELASLIAKYGAPPRA